MKQFRKPTSYWVAQVSAILGTVIVALATIPLQGSPLNYLWSILHDRGVIIYPMVYVIFLVLSYVLIARKRKDYTNSLILGLFFLALLPALLAFTVLVINVSDILITCGDFIAQYKDPANIARAKADVLYALAAGFDPLMIGLLSVAITYPLIFTLCFENNPEKNEAEPER